MSGGTTEIHRDDDPLVELEHRGANGAAAFLNRTQHLDVFLRLGLAAENSTQGTSGTITGFTEHTVTVGGVTWDAGDTLKVYKTATKNSVISTQWTDLSRGLKTPQDELIDGWREEDVDLNRNGEREVWSPGQPESYRR